MKPGYYIHRGHRYGVMGDPIEAVKDHPFGILNASDFETVSAEEYENTVLDWRYEDGEWQQ